MIADKSRGGHWTNALLGVKAKEVHVCGDSSVINLVKSFAEQCGDSFKVSLLIPVGPCVTCPVSQISNLQNLRNATCWFDSWTGHFFFPRVNPFPNNPWFSRVCSISLLKTLWNKEKLLVSSNFSFSHSVFYPFEELNAIFSNIKIVVCKPSQLGRV